jgi:hypothetical protein
MDKAAETAQNLFNDTYMPRRIKTIEPRVTFLVRRTGTELLWTALHHALLRREGLLGDAPAPPDNISPTLSPEHPPSQKFKMCLLLISTENGPRRDRFFH